MQNREARYDKKKDFVFHFGLVYIAVVIIIGAKICSFSQ
jgi:hypothetical protein